MITLSLDDPQAQAELAQMRKGCTDRIAEKRRSLKSAEDRAQRIASKLGPLSASLAAKRANLSAPKPMADDFASWASWKAALKDWHSEREGSEAAINDLEAQYRSGAQSLNSAQDEIDNAKVELVRAELSLAELEREIARKTFADREEEEGSVRRALLQVQHALSVARQRRQAA